MDVGTPTKQSKGSGNTQHRRLIKIAKFPSVAIAFSQIQFEFQLYLSYLMYFDTNKHAIKNHMPYGLLNQGLS